MNWIVLFLLGLLLLFFPKTFSKIGWFNLDNMNGNAGPMDKYDKQKFISVKTIYVYRMIGIVLIILSLIFILS